MIERKSHFLQIYFCFHVPTYGIEFPDIKPNRPGVPKHQKRHKKTKVPSIFRDNISAIPSYFENTESPIICYKYNRPIRNTILNFNKLVSDLDIETSSPDS